MSRKALRRLWFAGLWLLLPWPMLVLGDALVPAARYLILGVTAAAVAITEGAAGPVGPLVGLFLGMGVMTTLGCWLIAWGVARALDPLPPHLQRTITWVCLVGGLLIALSLDPYRTSFGREPNGDLMDVLS